MKKAATGVSVLFAIVVALAATPGGTADVGPRSVADAAVKFSLGPVEISTFNPITMTGLEESTNFYFDLRNTGSTPVTVKVPNPLLLPTVAFSVLPIMGFQANELTLAPGETRVAEYMVGAQGTGTASIDFPFSLTGTATALTIPIEIRAGRSPGWDDLSKSATITGTVTVSGAILPNVDVIIWSYSGRGFWHDRTDAAGRYSIRIPALEEISAAMGPRRFPYPTLSHFAYVNAPGYSLGYVDGIAPTRGATVVRDLAVTRLSLPTYDLVAEVKTDGVYGYFWMGANTAFTRFAAVQGQHPPELRRPGHIIMIDELGKTVWQKETGDECWGFDFVADRVAAGCHDGLARVLDATGPLLWSRQFGYLNRAVQFNPDGTRLLTGPDSTGPGNSHVHDAVMLNAATGQQLWAFDGGIDRPIRTIRFNSGGDRIAAGFSAGVLSMLDGNGTELWRRYTGEFPMTLEFDRQNNVYVIGKNEEVFSYDATGNLRWRSRVLSPSKAGILNMSAGNDQFVAATVTGFVHAWDTAGRVRWRRLLPNTLGVSGTTGHNGLYQTKNGRWIVAGTEEFNGTNSVVLFDRDGNVLWKHNVADRRSPSSYGGPQQGASSVVASEDARTIVAAYSDSVIRIFRLNETGGPTNLAASASGSTVTLTWSPPSSGTVDTYSIEAGSATGLADLANFSTGTTATSFSASGIANGTYYVRVRAGSAAGTSAASNETVLTVGGGGNPCTIAPSSPSNLTVSIAGGTVALSWTAAAGIVTSYVVEAGSRSGAVDLANSDLGSSAASFTAANVRAGTYFVRVRGKNACGIGAASNEIIATVR